MDLTELQLEYQPEKKLYMFLSLSWAIISDIDLNSERLRCMGEPRFTVWALYRVARIRHYAGKLSLNGVEVKSKKQAHMGNPE